jgi:hypothetical protein
MGVLSSKMGSLHKEYAVKPAAKHLSITGILSLTV